MLAAVRRKIQHQIESVAQADIIIVAEWSEVIVPALTRIVRIPWPGLYEESVLTMASFARDLSREIIAECVAAWSRAFKDWVDDQLASGAGGLHQLSKVAIEAWSDEDRPRHYSLDHAAAEREVIKWSGQWASTLTA